MDKNTRQTNQFGIVEGGVQNNTPLGKEYANNLFASDPDDVMPLGSSVSNLKDEDKQDDGPVNNMPFIDKDDDFIANLGKKKAAKQTEPEPDPDEDEDEDEDSQDIITQPKKSKSKKEDKQAETTQDTNPDTDEDQGQGDDNDDKSNHSIIPDFSKELFEMGLFTLDEDETIPNISTPEDLVDRFRYETRKGSVQILENILNQYGEDYRDAFDAIYINGVDPKEYFGHIERINNISSLDLSIVENQKMVMKHYYQTIGLDSNKAATKIERLQSVGDLEEEAKDVHQLLINQEVQELQTKEEGKKREIASRARQEQENINFYNKLLSDKMKAKDFDGIPVDEKIIRDTASYLVEKKWQLKDGRLISEFDKDILDLDRPENREMRAKLALMWQIMKTDPQFSRLQRKAVARETNEMFRSLQRERSTNKKQGRTQSKFFDD